MQHKSSFHSNFPVWKMSMYFNLHIPVYNANSIRNVLHQADIIFETPHRSSRATGHLIELYTPSSTVPFNGAVCGDEGRQ